MKSNSCRCVAVAIGASFAVALIGVAPGARAETEPDPFEDLFGVSGINTWTAGADSSLISSDPSLAGSLDASIDTFVSEFTSGTGLAYPLDPLSQLVWSQVPGAFSDDPIAGGLPLTSTGDLAVGLDYTVFASGLAAPVDSGITNFFESSLPTLSSDILFWLFFPEDLLGLIFVGGA